jgi:uncharacterized protein YabN with tetrapyrrole methylase and pyrophosphatase domain
VLAGVPRSLPALLRAYEIGQRAAVVGFDWPQASEAAAKVREELDELSRATDGTHIEEEVGDLLFAAANLSRKFGVEPEAALRRATDKFCRRFAQMEEQLEADGSSVHGAPLEAMEDAWHRVKARERTA